MPGSLPQKSLQSNTSISHHDNLKLHSFFRLHLCEIIMVYTKYRTLFLNRNFCKK